MAYTQENHISPWNYHVFLSFRGEDTRNNFTDRLYRALVHAGIQTFRDDDELRRGEDITSELLTAIEGSRVSVIIFSTNYADSRWCLDELVKILECKKKVKQIVLPVFYDIDPSDVRKQTGTFANAFSKHQKRFGLEKDERVKRWKEALTEAGNLSGWDLHDAAKGHESKFIQKIVEEISIRLNHNYFSSAIYPVGIDSRVEYLDSLLSVNSDIVQMVGICGMGGIGKTTIAKAVYNNIFHRFEGSSFIEDVKEIARRPNGLVQLQKRLLSAMLLKKKIDIQSISRGINVIKDRLCHRKILLILDDVDHLDQLTALAGQRNWFGLGSRIIITTRNEYLLKVIQVDEKYIVPKLLNDESLRLFSWHAFRQDHPNEAYMNLSKDVVGYAGGLPLALEVLGSFLFNETSIYVWKSALEKLKKIPNKDIHSKLRISYDGLSDDEEKNVFLDIACFFIGMDKDYVLKILDSCGFSSEINLRVLTQRCLLMIDEDKKLKMHNLLRDMGREIIRQDSPKEPGKRSRLWLHEDVLDVLTTQSGTRAVEGIVLNFLGLQDVVHLRADAFEEMRKLRLLNLNSVNLTGGYEHLSQELRWLCWRGFPLKFIPTTFHLHNLIALDMRYSGLTQIWKDNRVLNKLKFLNLSHSHNLSKTPNFIGLPNLEKLLLKDCTSLVEVHSSIGVLDRLVFLNLRDCKNLRKLPTSICMLKSLEKIILSGCSKLDELPEDLGQMESLRVLLADETAIRQVPFSINYLKNLRKLSLDGCKGSPPKTSLTSLFWSWVSSSSRRRRSLDSISLLPNSLSGLCSLRQLNLANCNLFEDSIPKDIGSLSSLQELDLRGNNFRLLPDTIHSLSKLQTLRLNDCERLQSLPELPMNLAFLIATNCSSLETISNVSNLLFKPTLVLDGCSKLVEIQGLDKLESLASIHLDNSNNMAKTLGKSSLLQELSERCTTSFNIPGSELPDWCSYWNMGSSATFRLPPLSEPMIKGLTICVIHSANEDLSNTFTFFDVVVNNKTKGLEWNPSTPSSIPIASQDHIWLNYIPHADLDNKLQGGDHLHVSVTTDYDCLELKKIGIRVVYEKGPHSICQPLIEYPSSSHDNVSSGAYSLDVNGDEDENVQLNGFVKEKGPIRTKRWGGDNDDDAPNPKRLKSETGP